MHVSSGFVKATVVLLVVLLAKRTHRRWTNLRVSADGRTMADVVEHRRKPTGKKVPGAFEPPKKKPPPPWISRHWFGPLVAERSDECLICEAPIEPGDTIIHRHSGGKSLVMCSMCATSISELEIHAIADKRRTD